MSNTAIEKRTAGPLKGAGQYVLTFSVIAALLLASGFPLFLLFFVGTLTFFIWKVFTSEGRNETRRVFEFYLSANEILRDDDRRWYGFEIQEAIGRGERIVRAMSSCPPLVHYALGALYHRIGDHAASVRHLDHLSGESSDGETAIVFPTRDLRGYVEMLRKIERTPAEAPLTYSAIRSLERARKNRTESLLAYSRSQLAEVVEPLPRSEQELLSIVDLPGYSEISETNLAGTPGRIDEDQTNEPASTNGHQSTDDLGHDSRHGRKTISEVLHDIYEENIQ